MPFIDDALLWCPDNDGRMVDISACLQDGNNGNQNPDVAEGQCDLNALDTLNDSDELFRQLAENTFELDNFLADFTAEVKQEENNNSLGLQTNLSNAQNFLAACTNAQQQQQQQNANLLMPSGANSSSPSSQQQTNAETALLALAATVSASSAISQHSHRNFSSASRFSIAANPLLAEKLLSPNINDLDSLTIGSRAGRPPDLKGDSYHSLMYLFRIPVCTIARIVPEVCSAIYTVLKDEYLKVPNTEEEWLQYADLFEKKWNFPHCLGALDGKHIEMFAPPNCGSTYYNYKGTHSVVLMVLADANYKIIYMDVGCKGRVSDGGVFNQCTLSDALAQNSLNIPAVRPLTENGPSVPYVIVADDAFALKPYIMKPYPFRNLGGPERVYNYRLSRARRIVENLFGILSARFRVLLQRIHLDEKKTTKIVLAICALHNFLMTDSDKYATTLDFDRETNDGVVIPGRWRTEMNNEMLPLDRDQQTNPTIDAKHVQNIFKNYFVSPEGEVSWQYMCI